MFSEWTHVRMRYNVVIAFFPAIQAEMPLKYSKETLWLINPSLCCCYVYGVWSIRKIYSLCIMGWLITTSEKWLEIIYTWVSFVFNFTYVYKMSKATRACYYKLKQCIAVVNVNVILVMTQWWKLNCFWTCGQRFKDEIVLCLQNKTLYMLILIEMCGQKHELTGWCYYKK